MGMMLKTSSIPIYKGLPYFVIYLTVTIKYAYLILQFCRLSHFAGINKCAMHVV